MNEEQNRWKLQKPRERTLARGVHKFTRNYERYLLSKFDRHGQSVKETGHSFSPASYALKR